MIHSPIQDPASLSLQEAIEAQNWTLGLAPAQEEPQDRDWNAYGLGWIVF